MTAHDLRPISPLSPPNPNLFTVNGNISDEVSIQGCIAAAKSHFGPINILVANAGITDESHSYPIWKIPLELWEKTYNNNIRGTFLTIKSFLQSAEDTQAENGGKEMENLAIVVTGSETGKFGQAGHTEYASGKAGLQYGLVRGVKNEIVRLNSLARINAVAPGWVNTPMIDGRLDDPKELWTEAQATVPLRKIAEPEDVARAMCFLASHRAAGHISGECLSIDGGMEGRVVWKAEEVMGSTAAEGPITAVIDKAKQAVLPSTSIPKTLPPLPTNKRVIQVLISVDFDAISGWLGTGAHPDNNMADYSTGHFAGNVGVPRLLKLFKKHKIESSVTWFIPGHSMESFPKETKMIVDSGAEIACHGYAHEGGAQMTETQERDVIVKCVELAEKLTGKKPRGWRAPLYQIREHTVKVLEQEGFLYGMRSHTPHLNTLYSRIQSYYDLQKAKSPIDTSLTHYDSTLYFLPSLPAITPIDFAPSNPASSWMQPIPAAAKPTATTLVEIPCNWYAEDMTPMQYLPHAPNSQGYVSTHAIESMWKDRFEYLYEESGEEGGSNGFIFPLVLHPDTSGMAHVIGMIDRMIGWLKARGDEVTFVQYGDCAAEWKGNQKR